ncbi:hypothetical protein GGI07_005041 [Coemansia sp. Benny D115]|nr:hypothetical protein GGI07_005041 [Coemansia sp. Benny D115]
MISSFAACSSQPNQFLSAADARIDKRKRRRPTRSLSVLESYRGARALHSLRLPFVDDYKRNPTAYSRALMDTERPNHSPTSPSHPPRSSSSSPLPLPPPPLRTSSSLHNMLLPENSNEAESDRVRRENTALRRNRAAAIQRLFPSLSGMHVPESVPRRAERRSAALEPPLLLSPRAPPSLHSAHQAIDSPPSSSAASESASRTASKSPTPPPGPASPSTGIKQFVKDEQSRSIFELKPNATSCSVKWAKAAPMDVSSFPLVEHLAPAERDCCSILRLYPEQYLTIKQALVHAGRTRMPGTFKKRDAQKLCRVDVNKTSKVFEWFCKLGWIPHASAKPNTLQ